MNPGWRVSVEGHEKIRKGVPYVMVSNRQSLLDIFAILRLFTHFKWVSKIENFKIEGTADALPKKGMILRGVHRFRVRVLDEIPAHSFEDTPCEELTLQVRNLFLKETGQSEEK